MSRRLPLDQPSSVEALPIERLRDDFNAHYGRHPIVLSAPTGSGKSTQIPRWCLEISAQHKDPRPVLVVEPRRVACRSLAHRVATLEGSVLGGRVGYTVRDEDRSGPQTLIRFVTSGVAIRMWAHDHLASFSAVVIDEFHERSLDVDLLLALCAFDLDGPLVIMSATFAGDLLAERLGGVHLEGEGKLYPITQRYLAEGTYEPSDQDLPNRVANATIEALDETEGDILVFLPGKAEIYTCIIHLERALERASFIKPQSLRDERSRELSILPLHGGLTLDEQSRIFSPQASRRVILSTNVAETSLTVPRVTAVIDSGLVRRTRYFRGRGALSLTAIAQDSADQRVGRAGRLGPGRGYRLWAQGAILKAHTPPEIYRESLTPLLLSAAVCGVHLGQLNFIDPPKPFALDEARAVLRDLNALNPDDEITSCGARLFKLGLDVALGRWIIEAQRVNNVADVVDLVSALSARRSIWSSTPPRDPEDHLRLKGCDAVALIRAMRAHPSDWSRLALNPHALEEARAHRGRLCRALDLQGPPSNFESSVDRRKLALTLLKADPRSAYVARRRRAKVAWCGVGPDMSLGHTSAPHLMLAEDPTAPLDALLVLDSHARGKNARQGEMLITAAMPIPLPWLKRAGLGEETLSQAMVKRGKLIAEVHLVFAKKVLDTREVNPQGKLAQDALVECVIQGRLWRGVLTQIKERLSLLDLRAQFKSSKEYEPDRYELRSWLTKRVIELGFEEGSDLELISQEDILPEMLDPHESSALEKEFPSVLKLSDATYHMHYNVARKRVIMEQVSGSRRQPPLIQWLPKWGGFEVKLRRGQHESMVRPRRR